MAGRLDLPKNENNWSARVVAQGINDQSIYTFNHAESGSKIGLKQFLLLRVLWTRADAHEIQEESERQLKTHLKTAGKLLRDTPDWKRYTSSCYKDLETLQDQGFAYLGTFALVRLYQLNTKAITASFDGGGAPKLDITPIAMRTRSRVSRASRRPGTSTPPSPTPLRRDREAAWMQDDSNLSDDAETASLASEFADVSLSEFQATRLDISPQSPLVTDVAQSLQQISDEQLVNVALLAYLDALLIHFPQLKASWTPERRAFTVKDRGLNKIYEARVDGFLRRRIDDEIIAIIEVKPFVRTVSTDAIRMQEGAQMAAWISQHPPTPSEHDRIVKTQGGKFRCAPLVSNLIVCPKIVPGEVC